MVVLQMRNFVDAMQGVLRVQYRMPALYMLREPLLLVASVAVSWLGCSLYRRARL